MADKPTVASSGPAVEEVNPLDEGTSFSDRSVEKANPSSPTPAAQPTTPDLDENPYAVLGGDLSFGLRPTVGRMAFDAAIGVIRDGYAQSKGPAIRGLDQESRLATALRGVAGMAFSHSAGMLETIGLGDTADELMGSHAIGGDADETTTVRWLNNLKG